MIEICREDSVIRETDKAILVPFNGDHVWLPKSACKLVDEGPPWGRSWFAPARVANSGSRATNGRAPVECNAAGLGK